MASSSKDDSKYDVYLSSGGEDTRRTFTDHLYCSLKDHRVNVFMYRAEYDDKLEESNGAIPEHLIQAIERSKVAVVVFSRRYPESMWCLEELVKIMECRETLSQMFFPIFFDVDPSDVRKQSGSFAQAFQKYEQKFNEDKVCLWRKALGEAGVLAGLNFRETDGHEGNFIRNVISQITGKQSITTSLEVPTSLVGIDSRVREISKHLNVGGSNDIRIIGVLGMCGLGKTTVAKAIFNKHHHNFDGASFLQKVREKKLVDLQEQLLSDILKPAYKGVSCIDEGTKKIEQGLGNRRVLVIIDDLDSVEQIDALAIKPDSFGPGSRIIITSRNKHLLNVLNVDKICPLPSMSEREALELLSLHAFRKNYPHEEYVELSRKAVGYCGGLPLALEVLGSYLCSKSTSEWETVFDKWKRSQPYREIHRRLEISYDGLTDDDVKAIFLDISCFFTGMNKDYVMTVLDGCQFYPEIGIRELQDQCLVTVDKEGNLMMHDLIQGIGREIVRAESPDNPGKRSRLWHNEDITDVLTKQSGTEGVEGLTLDMQESDECSFSSELFRNMQTLRLLKLNNIKLTGSYHNLSKELRWLCWHGFPLEVIPKDFDQPNLVAIDLSYSKLIRVWEESNLLLEKLKLLNLSHSHNLAQTPDFSILPNLEELIMNDCESVSEVHSSIGNLERLTLVNLEGCRKLKGLPNLPTSLQVLRAGLCTALETMPDFSELLNMRELYLSHSCKLTEIPGLDMSLNLMTRIHMEGCINLTAEFRKNILQGRTSCGYGDIFLNGNYIPDWFDFVKGDLVSFDIPVGRNFGGLTLCCIYSSKKQREGPLGLIVRNKTKHTALLARITCVSVPTSCSLDDNYLWQGHISNSVLSLRGGDKVDIFVKPVETADASVRVKKIAVNLVWDKFMKENMHDSDLHLYDFDQHPDWLLGADGTEADFIEECETSYGLKGMFAIDVDDVNTPPLREKYDVFLSFRGEDTRLTFTNRLQAALLRKKIGTYMDYRLTKGDEIGPALPEAIEKSGLSVIIFSKNYVSSILCLNELVHILECKKKYGQMVVSIFYDISPSDVRKQKGSYAYAFAELENRFKDRMDKVIEWKAALVEATDLSGFDYSNKKGTEADFIEKVVEDISTKLKRETSYGLKGMVGIESRIEQVESLLSTDDWQGVCTVGIWGTGGIGKTTLAKAVIKRLSYKFEAACFLSNVTEKSKEIGGADQLHKRLLGEILKEGNLSIDSTSVQQRLRRTKVLIVFDDVSDSMQIKDLACLNLSYGDGSRIIVTSRERSVLLNLFRDEEYIYQLGELNTDDALQLFQFHAFKDNSPREEYTELSARVVKYAGGIPLALEVLGSLFFPCKSKDEWEDVLSTLRYFPDEKIQNTFLVSYNRLGRNAQEVFLDIACFYKGRRIEDVKKMVDFGQLHGGSCAADGIRVLRDRSFISIDSEWETIDMHDLVQEMGWAIVRKQCIEEPGRRSRLFITEDIYHVLKNNTGTERVQTIIFPWSRIGLDRADFKKMYNMRLLSVKFWKSKTLNLKTLFLPNSLRYLDWGGYPLKSLPPEFSLENLVELRMPFSEVTQLWDGGQNPMNLKVIELHQCKRLTALPNLLGSPNIEHVDLCGCESLVEIPQHFKNLDKLTYLDLSLCGSLEYLPEMPGNIEFLSLSGSGIKELPSSVWSHEKISSLDITFCAKLKELPSNTCKLKVSGAFSLQHCSSLEKFTELPRGIGKLDLSLTRIKVLPTSAMRCLLCLTKLKLRNCMNIASLLPSICKLKSLEELYLSWCSELEVVPRSIYKLTNIKTLSFSYCEKLRKFPQPTGSVGFLSLEVLNLHGSCILEIPEGVICSTSLRVLNLGGTKIRRIPSSIKQVSQLSSLYLMGCESLRSLLELPVVRRLRADGCKSLKTVSSSRTAITRCWNRYELLREEHTFYYCPSLGYDARSSIMVDSQLRIMRVATASSRLKEEREDFVCFSTASSNLKEEEEEEGDCVYFDKEDYEKYSGPLVTIVCPGDEIPNWFVHQNEGASINVRLPANWFREGFLGFALSVASELLVPFAVFKCKYNFKTGEGESHEINCYFTIGNEDTIDDEIYDYSPLQHVFVLYKDLEYEERTKWSSAFYDRVTEVSVHFQEESNTVVEKCGMCLLYAEDAEKLKCDVMSQQEQDENAASGSGDPEASGSNESEEASGSDDSEGESGSGDPEASGSNESAEASGSDDYEGESKRRGSKIRRLV